jgi:hypothetical protein
MNRYLLAAEVDKIQDLIFRSARLREVVGGSQLLNHFCEEVSPLLLRQFGGNKQDLLINSGGSFRILFDQKATAEEFGERLAEVYRLVTGGTLTVADDLVEVNGDFDKASKQAAKNLRKAKQQRGGWHSPSHLPYVAFCASCGVGLAVDHRTYHPDDDDEERQYLCKSCLAKADERTGQKANDPESFLGKFYRIVRPSGDYHWPGRDERSDIGERDPVEDIADYDTRRYVAYLVADGNEMGRLFNKCKTPEQMRGLSQGLECVMREALAKPTKRIMETKPLNDRPNFIPTYPLILGGDDLFALIPAPWALDFASQFCREYEQRMRTLLEELGFNEETPTVSAAVVICKNKHPHRLAHETGERALKEAKRLSKRLAKSPGSGGKQFSVVNFDVVLSGGLVPPDESERKFRPTLRPYWVTDGEQGNKVPEGWGLPILRLLEAREKLEAVEMPRKRLIEFRDLYERDNLQAKIQDNDLEAWMADLEHLLKRIDRKEEQGREMREVLKQLGGGAEVAYWHRIQRGLGEIWHGHGLPDLLLAWDFAQTLEHSQQNEEEA